MNAPQCYVIRTLPVLFVSKLLCSQSNKYPDVDLRELDERGVEDVDWIDVA
jgi:hypothetical protein